jgi:hypothetical protein
LFIAQFEQYNQKDKVMKDSLGRSSCMNGRNLIAYGTLEGNQEGNGPLGNPRRRRVDNIEVDLRENRLVWTGLIWLRRENSSGLFGLP